MRGAAQLMTRAAAPGRRRPAFRGARAATAGRSVYFLRKVIWLVPGFTVQRYRSELRALHDRIGREGSFTARATRFLIEARKPG